ncbi:MAG: L,D-transpeptidase [Ignavibacteriae bacterium]|jgi:hypothetical protein|nr:L,D-transpeptidase [Ignavibacteriota bacterium]
MKKILLKVIIILIAFYSGAFAQYDTLVVEAQSLTEADASIKEYIKDRFPIISDKLLDKIASKKFTEISDKPGLDSIAAFYNVKYPVPSNFLLDTVKILWELNIPEFRSHLFQLYGKDTIYIDTWNNVLGTAATKTYAGYFEAFRIRNWPTWKDPEKGKEQLPATPPGPNNPLGLFVVHYDENSLRYFHGTNKNYLIYSKMRNLSHGCVRNDNANIARMKEFILKRVIKSKDLTSWMDSKKSMTYDLETPDKFPVRIIYKTFTIDKDDKGAFVELYKDIYGYKNERNIDAKWNEESLITLTTKENIIAGLKKKLKDVTPEKIGRLADYIISNCDEYERYYIDDMPEGN